MQVVNTEKVPIKMWLDEIENGAMEQIKNLANLPFTYKWVAVMPDSHQGYGMPIGGVLACDGVIIPNAVGVDIGCGMCAVKTDLQSIDVDMLKRILGEIRKRIPVGFAHHQKPQDESLMPYDGLHPIGSRPVVEKEYKNALTQLGTLGGGNHFIEIQKGNDDFMWIMIHSGSRNLGKTVADVYNNIAIELMKKYHVANVVEQELAFLPVDTDEGKNYINEMQYCVDFALANRKLMMDRVCAVIKDFTGAEFEPMINIAHNYARLENHFGKNVWVHRKGATSARQDEIGIIPGSMGTKSYIVKGKGNKESFESCSHGAGRRMSRSQADKTITLEQADESMKGVVYGRWGKNRNGGYDFSEAPQAYKNIDEVIENEKDLVDVLVELKPLAVVKG